MLYDQLQIRLRFARQAIVPTVILVAGLATAAQAAQPGLRLRAGVVSPTATTSTAIPIGGRCVIQLAGVLSSAQRAQLDLLGIKLDAFVPPNAYLARLNKADAATVRGLPFVTAVGPFQASWRLDPELTALTPVSLAPSATARSRQSNTDRVRRSAEARARLRARLPADRAALLNRERVRVTITTFADEDPAEARTSLTAIPGVSINTAASLGASTVIDAEVPVSVLETLAARPFVQFVEHAPVGTLRNAVTGPMVQSGTSDLTPVWDVGLHGEGQIVGLIDAAPPLSHCMFSDVVEVGSDHRKFVASRPLPPLTPHVHGTMVAGVLAGDAGLPGVYDAYDGVAFAARISYSDYFAVNSAPATLLDRLVDAHNDGARIHTNSWGDDTTAAYTIWCNIIDQFSYDHEDDLVIFAATNDTLLHSPENAKNVLAVGASSQYPSHDYHCYGGAGPTLDGRRKPEIFAPGCGVRSASYSTECGLRFGSGTSYAAPAIAGAAALARQYYLAGFYPAGRPDPAQAMTPSGALLRATLLNATVDMVGETGYPSSVEGWGRLVLDRALYFAGDARRLIVHDVRHASGLLQGTAHQWEISVFDESLPLQLTLVFTDPPAAIGTADPVVNNLDLIVTGPSGDVYVGNAFANGVSALNSLPDAQNTVEQVLLPAPARGAYLVTVSAFAINGPAPQGYAVAASGAVLPGAYSPPADFGDANIDGDRDLADFAAFQACFSGDGAAYGDSACHVFDADADGDIDEVDFGPLQQLLSGPIP